MTARERINGLRAAGAVGGGVLVDSASDEEPVPQDEPHSRVQQYNLRPSEGGVLTAKTQSAKVPGSIVQRQSEVNGRASS